MSTLKDRIEQVLLETDLTPADLARMGGVESSAVSQWRSGLTKTLKARVAANLEFHTGYRSDWLANGRGTPRAQGVSHRPPQASEDVPSSVVYGARTAIRMATMLPVPPWGRLQHMAQPNDSAIFNDLEHRFAHDSASPSAKLVEVNDPAMAPRLGQGDTLQLDPTVAPQPGALVLVRQPNGEHLVRVYRQRTPTAWQAVPINANYATLDSEADGITVIATATHRIERLT